MNDRVIPSETEAAAPPNPTPIFVLGVQRSGTTWMANLLAEHSQVTAVQSADHFGIHESIFFSHFARAYGDLAERDNFERFARDFTTSDYYLLTGIEADWFWRLQPRSYPEAFRALMDETAWRRGGTRYWIEKSPHHTVLADELRATFPDARFICITRRRNDTVRSYLASAWDPPPRYPGRLLKLVRLTWTCDRYHRHVERFQRQCDKAWTTTYEALKADTADLLGQACAFLDLSWEPAMMVPRYAKNSSFRSRSERRRQDLSLVDRTIVSLAAAIFSILPLRWIDRVAGHLERRRGVLWPDWCWRRRDGGEAAISDCSLVSSPPTGANRPHS